MKVVVVTGATGFIGGRFAKYLLSQNYQVYAVITETVNSEIGNLIRTSITIGISILHLF